MEENNSKAKRCLRAPFFNFKLMIKYQVCFVYLLLLVMLGCQKPIQAVETEGKYKIIGYIAGWKNIDYNKIKADKLTHINYAFANVIDGMVVEGQGREVTDKVNIEKLNALKEINPELKILISIGGWTWSKGFSDAVLTESGRKKFTDSAIAFMLKHNLDGLDFDWEYPALPVDNNPFRPEDKENFVLMLQSVRGALDSLGAVNQKHYLSTIASAGFKEYLDVNDLGKAQQYLDFINIMTYDLVVQSTSDTTDHHTNLTAAYPWLRSAEKAVLDHVSAGVPIEKLVLGIAFYGRSWSQVNPVNNGLRQFGKGSKGYSYRQILSLEGEGFERHWDEKSHAPYLWHPVDSIFITYEDPQSIQAKAEFIRKNRMGGAMFWEYSEDTDDNQLLEAINKGLN
jgi:chitinase